MCYKYRCSNCGYEILLKEPLSTDSGDDFSHVCGVTDNMEEEGWLQFVAKCHRLKTVKPEGLISAFIRRCSNGPGT